MAHKRLLMVFAHPDDESFGMGGTIAKYVAEGVDVYYVCATDGDRGTIPEAMQGQYPTIRELRLAELECAAQTLGFKNVLLHYKDSGMMGSETTNDPECLWYHWQHTPADVTRRVVQAIREIQPQVIVTFNKYGGYGHPDHIAIQRATTEAFYLAGDKNYLQVALPPYQPQKLYYTSLPARFLKLMLNIMRFQAWVRRKPFDPRRVGTNNDIDFLAVIENIEPIHARVTIRDYLGAWDAASKCHASQGGGGMMSRFPMWLRQRLIHHQGFTRVYPAPSAAKIDEDDLFANVMVEPERELAL